MYSYTKVKKDFSYRNVKFKGIECYEGDGNSIEVTTTGTAQMIRQILKNKYPKIDGQGTWVKTRKFSGGNSIDVYLNRPPESIYNEINAYLKVFDSWAVNHRGEKREQKLSDDGIKISAYTSYLFVNNTPPYDSKESGQPAPDWDKILSESTPAPKSSGSSPKASWDKGELLRECGGWKVYKKTLPDGRVVFSAFKDKETAPNKADWNLIKGEIYTETGFKWGRFGNFEKWGNIEDLSVLDKLCAILTKYYGGGKEEPKKEDTNRIKRIVVRINGEFYGTWINTTEEDIYIELGAKFGGVTLNKMIANGQIAKIGDNTKTTINIITYYENIKPRFVYGLESEVPSAFGQELLWQFILNGYAYVPQPADIDEDFVGFISVFKEGFDPIYIFGNTDFTKFTIDDKNEKTIGSVNYLTDDRKAIQPAVLFSVIDEIYTSSIEGKKQEPKEVSKEDVEKQIKALKYLAEAGDTDAEKQIKALKYLLN